MKNLKNVLEERKFKNNYSPPEESIVMTIQDKTIGCLQSFVVVQGLPKNGKSLITTSLISSAFTPYDIFSMKIKFPEGRKRLCYVDTESSEFDFYKVLERIKKQIIASAIPDNLDAYLFREDAPNDIMGMVDIYLNENSDCSVLVLDGILDLIADFNSVHESFSLIQWMKKITKQHNLLLVCVLHLGKKDGLSIGHIGSFLDRKAQSVLKVEKNKEANTIDLSPQFLRSIDTFNPISIQFTGNHWEQVNNEKINDINSIDGIDKKFLLNRVLEIPKTYKQLVQDFSEAIGKGHTTTKKIIRDFINEGTIVKNGEMYENKKRSTI